MPIIIANFGELWLRGRNRNRYVTTLINNLSSLIGSAARIRNIYDRLMIETSDDNLENVLDKLKHAFGISRFYVAEEVKPSERSILNAAYKAVDTIISSGEKGIKLEVHRSYKGFNFDSSEIYNKVAKYAHSKGIGVGSAYSKRVVVSVKKDSAFISSSVHDGLGGLPVGSSGKAVVLFSGGIDSPVSAFYAAKRGAMPIYIHLHPFKSNKEVESTKIERLINILASFHGRCTAYYIPAYIFQAAASSVDSRYETVLFKSFMFKIADKIAEREGARAIYTGESLGQVASQTMANIGVTQAGIKLPILRPLIGFDKNEIIRVAKMIGTFEESVKPYKDVCSISRASPVTNAKYDVLHRLSASIGMSAVVRRSLKLAEAHEIG